MSVIEVDKIDGMGLSKISNELNLLITDHLNWEDEYNHLTILQNKINAYLGFIESKQYLDTYPESDFEGFVIEIHFQYGMSENCFKFLDVAASHAEKLRTRIRIEE